MSKTSLLQYAAAGFTVAAIAFGAYAAGNARSAQQSGTPTAAASAAQAPSGGQLPSTAQTQSGGQLPPSGQVPGGGQAPPGFGTPVSGTAATKAAKAAVAKYPGSVEAVMQLSDGSYVVHVITSSGEDHVAVSSAFQVTGVEQRGGFGGRGGPDDNGGAPGVTTSADSAQS